MTLTSFVSHRLHACLAALHARARRPLGARLEDVPTAAARGPQLRAIWQAHPGHGKLQLRLHWSHDAPQEPPSRSGPMAWFRACLRPSNFI